MQRRTRRGRKPAGRGSVHAQGVRSGDWDPLLGSAVCRLPSHGRWIGLRLNSQNHVKSFLLFSVFKKKNSLSTQCRHVWQIHSGVIVTLAMQMMPEHLSTRYSPNVTLIYPQIFLSYVSLNYMHPVLQSVLYSRGRLGYNHFSIHSLFPSLSLLTSCLIHWSEKEKKKDRCDVTIKESLVNAAMIMTPGSMWSINIFFKPA